MGRPPCCDKDGIKKGPWTPEEDIILVSYIQQHGPGNWRSVPANTGLLRCSKSCRLRWTNYLRPGIKRGNFTPHEEGMIIHLQALLGNKWAAIASYLPQRTDNDIKNYWNTHLKKKLKRFESGFHQEAQSTSTALSSASTPKSTNDNHHPTPFAVEPQLSLKRAQAPSSACYASSTENISRLLENWMNDSAKPKQTIHKDEDDGAGSSQANMAVSEEEDDNKFDSILSFGNNDNNIVTITEENNNDEETNPPLTFLEKWLLDENTPSRQVVEEILQLPPIF